MPDENSNTRYCKRCNQTKPLAEFHPGKKVGYTCILCFRVVSRESYQRNREKRRAQIRAYGKANPAGQRARFEKYRAKDPGRYKALQHDWYLRNKDRRKVARAKSREAAPWVWQESTRRWRQQNREKLSVYKRNRIARERGAEGRYGPEDVEQLYKRQGGKCENCKRSISKGFHVDHIMPIIRGGTNWPENLQLLCPPCNRKKGAMHPEEWAKRNERLF